jgi:hypothetical protein
LTSAFGTDDFDRLEETETGFDADREQIENVGKLTRDRQLANPRTTLVIDRWADGPQRETEYRHQRYHRGSLVGKDGQSGHQDGHHDRHQYASNLKRVRRAALDKTRLVQRYG